MLRVAELVRHAMSDILARGLIVDPIIEAHVVTVSRVKMAPDLKLATIYIMPLGGKDVETIITAFDKHRKFLRGEIAHRLSLKFAPDVRFRFDDSFENAARIDALLHSDKVRKDLEPHDDERKESDH
jgi:ribosome-binding factor A